MSRRAVVTALATAALLSPFVARPARAANEAAAAAGALFEQARADAARGDYERACRRFTESLRLTSTPGTLLNLADCEEHRGHLADALESYRHGLESLAPSDDRVAFVRGRIARLSPRVPRVRLRAREASLSVSLDGVALSDAALGVPLPVNPGIRHVQVRARGRAPREYTFTAGEGVALDLDLAPGAPLPPAPLSAAADPPSHVLAWTAVGIGAAGFATATVAGILALGSASAVRGDCPDHRCTTATGVDRASAGQAEATVSSVGLGVGVIGAGLATYAFLRDRGAGATATATTASATVSPLLGPSVAGLSVGGAFR